VTTSPEASTDAFGPLRTGLAAGAKFVPVETVDEDPSSLGGGGYLGVKVPLLRAVVEGEFCRSATESSAGVEAECEIEAGSVWSNLPFVGTIAGMLVLPSGEVTMCAETARESRL
jgi:hypothetical protein